jgi:hypothetical protein
MRNVLLAALALVIVGAIAAGIVYRGQNSEEGQREKLQA